MALNGDSEVVRHLYSRGQMIPPQVTALTGGVSAKTWLVETPPARFVVKRTLPRLLVEREWVAKPERAMTEARALELLHRLTPQCTPKLLDYDEHTFTLVMSAAPADWMPWKSILLGTADDPSKGVIPTASSLGTLLGGWHAQTWGNCPIADTFDDYEAFDQLRIRPFHRAAASVHPDLAEAIGTCARELMERRECLVHGDFSPKNVLVGPEGLMVLDFEVAHFGAAVFDLAFVQAHLVLKALHRPERSDELGEGAVALIRSYEQTRASRAPLVCRHTACILLARVDGLSPVDYLDPSSAAAARRLARDLLAAEDGDTEELWRRFRTGPP